TMLINAPADQKVAFDHVVEIETGGASPPPKVIKAMSAMGFRVTHLYGLTEVHGPSTLCVSQEAWDRLSEDQRAAQVARQGVRYPVVEGQMVADPKTLKPVPADGKTMGEVMLRGNSVMLGYLKDPAATAAAFRGGWFHTGDLGVQHPDGYMEIKDRLKDIIISGGENISTIEVEQAIASHPAVLECAVIAVPDQKWGEAPKAFVTLKPGQNATAAEIIEHVRSRIARFKAPRSVEFSELPKTSTGKIQKYVLREREWAGREKRIN
ncbi:MAG TPA: AMP-binding protein, partial [Candidatus Acidoferrales bacterium]|nr:AMP-binding protein [Candidatus Acidoferrales bacterium]